MANMVASQCDTRLGIKRGLTVGKDKYGSLVVRNVNDSTLLGSVDSKKVGLIPFQDIHIYIYI